MYVNYWKLAILKRNLCNCIPCFLIPFCDRLQPSKEMKRLLNGQTTLLTTSGSVVQLPQNVMMK